MQSSTGIWLGRAVFVSLGLFFTLIAMLPLGLAADAMHMPDLFFCAAFAWIIRRHETAPLALIFVTALFGDIMLMRPLGLWTMITIILMEAVRTQRIPLREQMFVVEWLIFMLVFALALGLNSMILSLSFHPALRFDLALDYFINTALAYPFIAALLHFVFRVRQPRVLVGASEIGRIS